MQGLEPIILLRVLSNMKIKSALILLFLIAGCSSQPTYNELIDEALRTGDWEAVESREQMAQRRGKINDLECPRPAVSVCRETGAMSDCACVQSKGRRTP